jgi:hypothetical protein
MNNNPFLKSKESNNRFNFLDDEDTNKSSFKESSNKSNRKNIHYDSSQNSFTQSSKPRDRDGDRDRDRDRDSYRNNNRRNNDYKPRPREPSPPPVIVELDATDSNLFPELTPIKENTTIVKASTNFKDILTNVIEDEKPKVNPIPPGWLQLSSVNGKTVFDYGPKTAWMIKQEKQEELEAQLDEDPNYIMFQAIEQMKKNWDRYERNYDSINGEGAYAERFRLPPVYGPEYDTESEEEDDSQYEDDM